LEERGEGLLREIVDQGLELGAAAQTATRRAPGDARDACADHRPEPLDERAQGAPIAGEGTVDERAIGLHAPSLSRPRALAAADALRVELRSRLDGLDTRWFAPRVPRRDRSCVGLLALLVLACPLACEPRATKLAAPPVPEPVAFVAPEEVQAVAVGWNDICLLMADRSVRCQQDWRPKDERRLGSFKPVDGATDVVELAAGHHHACARDRRGEIRCWGRDEQGETGGSERLLRRATVVPLPAPAVELHASEHQTCARLENQAVFCWGAVAGTPDVPPTPIGWFPEASGIALSEAALCAHTPAGLLRCSFAGRPPLSPVGAEVVVRQVVLARHRGCALEDSGRVFCFSSKAPSGAGGSDPPSPWAEPVRDLDDATRLAAGTAHFCALRRSGAVACWGDNRYGQLGDRSRTGSAAPRPVHALADAITIAAGGDRSCARRPTKFVCWGADLLNDALYRALTGYAADPGPPSNNDSLAPEELRVPVLRP
jgi:hypothetical protein